MPVKGKPDTVLQGYIGSRRMEKSRSESRLALFPNAIFLMAL